MEDGYLSETNYDFGPEDLAAFVSDIFQARDELAVLIATIADGQRREDAGNYPRDKWHWLHHRSNRDRLRKALNDALAYVDVWESESESVY